MEIKKSTTYEEFVGHMDKMSKMKRVETMRVTPTVSVVCLDEEYYEVDAHKQTFGRLRFVSAMSYQRGAVIPKERIDALKRIKHDIEVSSNVKDRCKICCFRRVNLIG